MSFRALCSLHDEVQTVVPSSLLRTHDSVDVFPTASAFSFRNTSAAFPLVRFKLTPPCPQYGAQGGTDSLFLGSIFQMAKGPFTAPFCLLFLTLNSGLGFVGAASLRHRGCLCVLAPRGISLCPCTAGDDFASRRCIAEGVFQR